MYEVNYDPQIVEKELAGLLPTLAAEPEQFDHCNRCKMPFITYENGVVNGQEARRHKRLCRPTTEELFPPQDHILRRFTTRIEQVPLVMDDDLIMRDNDPFERRSGDMEFVDVTNAMNANRSHVAY